MYGLPQTSALMALGLFIFNLHTVPYQQLQRQTTWRHPAVSRVGRRPAMQFVGPGEDTITLNGVIHADGIGSKVSLDALRMMSDTGRAWPLIEGTGWYYGLFVITEINETSCHHWPNGGARKIEFSIRLARMDDDSSLLGQITRPLLAALDL